MKYLLMLMLAVLYTAESSETHHISTGSGPSSLEGYLYSNNLTIPSFSTLVLAPGVHSLCANRGVIVRDATHIALIGSEVTHTSHVATRGGEMVDIIEPSSVIDCMGCQTGLAFINVSHVSVKKISFLNCGAHYDDVLVGAQFTSSLTLSSVHSATLDTILFNGEGRDFHLVAVNVLGPSQIKSVAVVQEVYGEFNWTIPASFLKGGILISYTDNVSVQYSGQTVNSSTGVDLLDIDSVVMFFMVDIELGSDFLLSIKLAACGAALENAINITLQNVAVHIWLNDTNKIVQAEDVLRIIVDECVNSYQLSVRNVKLSANASHLSYKPVYLYYRFVLVFTGTLQSHQAAGLRIKTMDLSKLDISDDYVFSIYSSIDESVSYHSLLFDNCKFSHFRASVEEGSDPLRVIIKNSSFEHTAIEHSLEKSLFYGYRLKNVEMINCTFSNNVGPGLHLLESHVRFTGHCVVYNNTADYGGGLLVEGAGSRLHLSPQTILNFTGNTARVTGGAIHIDDRGIYSRDCLIQIEVGTDMHDLYDIVSVAKEQGIQIVFDSNTAGVAGTTLWGGEFDDIRGCYMLVNNESLYTNILPLLDLSNDATNPSVIASSPRHICYCYENKSKICTPFYYYEPPPLAVFPGQQLELDVAVAGQLNGLVPGLVEAGILYSDNLHLGDLEGTQRIDGAECTTLVYTFLTSSEIGDFEDVLFLDTAEDVAELPLEYNLEQSISDSSELGNHLSIEVMVKRCPLGFEHSFTDFSCVCLGAILRYVNSSCDIGTQTVQRAATLWMNATYTTNYTQTLAIHEHCPFDYCDPNRLRIDLRFPDEQCSHDRGGVLCGGCRLGLSLTLGSPDCRQCSDDYLSLLLVFVLAGLALVALLTVLNLTVSVGTINALILYANIVRALNPIFFPSTNLFSVFVAWLNLDIGISTCFYDGLDFYSLTWLQFLFPVYIWLIMSVMIFTSHYSTTAAKLISRDAVKVLATLVLLSYAKLLRTILIVFSYTYVIYEDSSGATHRTAVWLHDGNVEFLRGKHIPLFLVGVVFGVLYIIPFTSLLLFSPCLQTSSHHHRALRWVSRVMPFLDAYQGPYNTQYRYWPGLTLLVRVALFVSITLNTLGDPDINLMLTNSLVLGLLSLKLVLGMKYKTPIPYKSVYINYLEIFHLLDLGLLCTWSLVQQDTRNSATGNALVGLVFVVFIGILCYHTYLRIKAKVLVKLWEGVKEQRRQKTTSANTGKHENQNVHVGSAAKVQSTYVDIRECRVASSSL